MSTNPNCGWCEDTAPDHKHFAVLVRENGRLLGRLCPDGTTTTRNVHAAIVSRATADRVAADITNRPMTPGLTASVIPF